MKSARLPIHVLYYRQKGEESKVMRQKIGQHSLKIRAETEIQVVSMKMSLKFRVQIPRYFSFKMQLSSGFQSHRHVLNYRHQDTTDRLWSYH